MVAALTVSVLKVVGAALGRLKARVAEATRGQWDGHHSMGASNTEGNE